MDDLRFLDPEALVNRAAFNERFGLLNAAALYKTVTPTAQLGTLTEGTIIYLNENGSPVPFYVAKQGYEPDYNTDRVLVVRKDAVQQGAWNSSGVNTYDGSTIDTWFNQTYLQTLDSDVQTVIGTTNIPYTPMGGITTVQRTSKAVFALSYTELGMTGLATSIEGSTIPVSNLIRTSGIESPFYIWTRTPNKNGSVDAVTVQGGSGSTDDPAVNTSSPYYRPAFTLPSTFLATLGPETSGLYDLSDNLLLTLPGVQIETGSYVGTGTYGTDNPNSLTLGFAPKWVLVYQRVSQSNNVPNNLLNTDGKPYIQCEYLGTQFGVSSAYYQGIKISGGSVSGDDQAIKSEDGKTISWRSTSADFQANALGYRYDYIAFG